MPTYKDILAQFRKHGQDHVLAGWDKLFPDQQDELLADCELIDFEWIDERWAEYTAAREAEGRTPLLEPASVMPLPKDDDGIAQTADARAAGEEALRQGKVAAFLVAGGQGTRLGFDGPKGSYPVGPVSGRSLFQWHAEQILARSRRYGAVIPWYIMTSVENDRATKSFFDDNDYFGLPRKDVFFFQQQMVPCLDLNGKLMLASPSRLAMNPNGHGGSLLGLKSSGALKNMRERGIEYISYFQVDNPLVVIADPVFLGWHLHAKSRMSTKVVEKNSPGERMGVVCLQDGRPAVVEYMDMSDADKEATTPDGKLKYWAGNVAIHVIDVDFADAMAEGRLPWHQSLKKVAYFAGNRLVKPEKENAVKFETFVFDALPHAERSLNLEVRREQEFAPLKNATGADSVESCRRLLSNHFCEWLALCGISVPVVGMTAGSNDKPPVVEISPLYSLDAEELAGKIRPDGFELERFLLLG